MPFFFCSTSVFVLSSFIDTSAVSLPDDPFDPEWEELQAYLADKDQEKKKTRKLKKSSKGHSRYGRGGGAIPMDVLESKTAPRGLLGPRKRKY